MSLDLGTLLKSNKATLQSENGKTLIEQASVYAIDFLKQMWNDPTKTITFLTILGVVLV
jgi:hypothetical protein